MSATQKLVSHDQWYWFYTKRDRYLNITVLTDDGVRHYGKTWYKDSFLLPEVVSNPCIRFSEKDYDDYVNFLDRIADLNFSHGMSTKIALYATGFKRFHRELAVVCEYFRTVPGRRMPEVGEVVIMATSRLENGKSVEGNFIVVDHDEATCYCMLITSQLLLTDTSCLNLGGCVRVPVDCVVRMSALSNKEVIQTLNIA